MRTIIRLSIGLALAGWTPSALDPQGSVASDIRTLFWQFTVVCLIVWVLVMIALAAGLLRARTSPDRPPAPAARRVKTAAVATASAATVVTVTALATLSFWTDRQLLAMGSGDPVRIRVTGHQWWWELRYDDPQPSRIFTTANELHVPVGRKVVLTLESLDVIHSFWVPNLAGKMDLIPGRQNELSFDAAEPGEYQGQCAEFCGYQHAHMRLTVIAEPAERFNAWKENQIKPAASPGGNTAPGRDVFMSAACMTCHTIRGTTAGGRSGPELTHVGSRRSIAAGTLPLTHDDLVSWIADPQQVKPGANMPKVELSDGERQALAVYLESLK